MQHQPRVTHHPQVELLDVRRALLHATHTPQRARDTRRDCGCDAFSAQGRAPQDSARRTDHPAVRRGQPHGEQVRLSGRYCCGQRPLLPRHVSRIQLQQHAAVSHGHEVIGVGAGHATKGRILRKWRGPWNSSGGGAQHNRIHKVDAAAHVWPLHIVHSVHIVRVCHQIFQRYGHLSPAAVKRPLHVVLHLHFKARRIPCDDSKGDVDG